MWRRRAHSFSISAAIGRKRLIASCGSLVPRVRVISSLPTMARKSKGTALRNQYTPVLGCFHGVDMRRAICSTAL